MERMYNNQRVNVNPKVLKRRRKYNLRRIAAGLAVVGVIFTASATYVIKKNQNNNTGFDYDQSKSTTLAEQYEQVKNVDLSPEEELLANQMKVYDITRDSFNEVKNDLGGSEINKTDTRMELVSQTRGIRSVGLEAIKLKVKEAVCMPDADVTIKESYEDESGETFYTISVEKGGNTFYTFTQNEIPNDIKDLVNNITALDKYKGTGENEAWKNDITSFEKQGEEVYNKTLDFLDNDYEVNGNSLNAVEKEQVQSHTR